MSSRNVLREALSDQIEKYRSRNRVANLDRPVEKSLFRLFQLYRYLADHFANTFGTINVTFMNDLDGFLDDASTLLTQATNDKEKQLAIVEMATNVQTWYEYLVKLHNESKPSIPANPPFLTGANYYVYY